MPTTYEELERKYNLAVQELAILAQWKKETLTVNNWWQKIDTLVREKDGDRCVLGQQVSDVAWNRLCDYYELRSALGTLKRYL